MGVQVWFFDRQRAKNVGLLLADRGESCNGLGLVERNAVVLDAAGQIVGRGYNTREADGDPLAHAEIIAMRQAAQALGAWNLADCTLAVTLNPRSMSASDL